MLDLYRDLLPGLVARFLQELAGKQTLASFGLACRLHCRYQAFRPLVHSVLHQAGFNPCEALVGLLRQAKTEARQIAVAQGLCALHSLLVSSGVAYITVRTTLCHNTA